MLRITINEPEGETMRLKLEGRITGPWAEELDRVWVETAPRLGSRKLIIDLSNVTYADASGKSVLGKIFSTTNAEFVAGTLLTQDLAAAVVRQAQRV
jgi:anti-anti-sigma regulatory factor